MITAQVFNRDMQTLQSLNKNKLDLIHKPVCGKSLERSCFAVIGQFYEFGNTF